jgi:hypothetical protein
MISGQNIESAVAVSVSCHVAGVPFLFMKPDVLLNGFHFASFNNTN